jgi:hypothetical protein
MYTGFCAINVDKKIKTTILTQESGLFQVNTKDHTLRNKTQVNNRAPEGTFPKVMTPL